MGSMAMEQTKLGKKIDPIALLFCFPDSIHLTVNDIRGHRVDLTMVQLKTKTMTEVEANVEGVPAAIVFTQTMRHSTFPAQGIYTMTMERLLQVHQNMSNSAKFYSN